MTTPRRSLLCIATLALAGVAGCGGTDAPAQQATPSAWRTPELQPPTTPPAAARIAGLPGGRVVAVWATRPGGTPSRLLSAIREADGTWGAPRQVAPREPVPRTGVRVTANRRGQAIASWALWDRPSGAVFAFTQTATMAADGTWGPTQTLSRGTNGLAETGVAHLDDGTAMVVWSGSERRDGSYHPGSKAALRVRGRWQAGRVIGDGQRYQLAAAAVPSTRSIVTTWERFDGNTKRRLMSQTWRSRGGWTPPRAVSGPSDRPQEMTTAANPAGWIIAAWGGGGRGLHIAHRSPTGGWGTPRTLLSSGYLQGLTASLGDDGTAVITATIWRGATRPVRLEAWTVTANGAPSRTVLSRTRIGTGPGNRPSLPSYSSAVNLTAGGGAAVAWAGPTQPQDRSTPVITVTPLDGSAPTTVPTTGDGVVGAIRLTGTRDGAELLEWEVQVLTGNRTETYRASRP
ncbi:MAG: hypothetical protein IT200_10650 [Thermoleophilia bacterium]|nr:hypothetical protein [Thermoleophilia bacterium]